MFSCYLMVNLLFNHKLKELKCRQFEEMLLVVSKNSCDTDISVNILTTSQNIVRIPKSVSMLLKVNGLKVT